MCMYVRVCVCVCMYLRACVCVCVCVCVCICVCKHVRCKYHRTEICHTRPISELVGVVVPLPGGVSVTSPGVA
jgi:hypothetical protein